MDEATAQSFDDVVPEFLHFESDFDFEFIIRSHGNGIRESQIIRKCEVIRVQGMTLDHLSHVHKLPQKLDFGRDFYGQRIFHGTDGCQFMRDRANGTNSWYQAHILFGCSPDCQTLYEAGTFVEDELDVSDDLSIDSS